MHDMAPSNILWKEGQESLGRTSFFVDPSATGIYSCLYPGCNQICRGTFELERHVKMEKHGRNPETDLSQASIPNVHLARGLGPSWQAHPTSTEGTPDLSSEMPEISKKAHRRETKLLLEETSSAPSIQPSLPDPHPPRPGATIFSQEANTKETGFTNDSFADWLFEPDTAKGFMALQDTAGGRSESRKTRGTSEDYLENDPGSGSNDEETNQYWTQ